MIYSVWIGLSDIIGEGQFRWVNSRVMTWTYWEIYQPNMAFTQNCVEYSYNFGWEDRECGVANKFICQDKTGNQIKYRRTK